MNQQCSISADRINERAARINAGLTLLLLAVFLLTSSPVVLAFLLLDFVCRGLLRGRFSILGFVSRSLFKALRVQPVLVNAGPKIFAVRLGLLFSAIVAGLELSGAGEAAWAAAVVFALPVALEAVFGYCVGCRIYTLLITTREVKRRLVG
jgi:hypothetical protein